VQFPRIGYKGQRSSSMMQVQPPAFVGSYIQVAGKERRHLPALHLSQALRNAVPGNAIICQVVKWHWVDLDGAAGKDVRPALLNKPVSNQCRRTRVNAKYFTGRRPERHHQVDVCRPKRLIESGFNRFRAFEAGRTQCKTPARTASSSLLRLVSAVAT
jgi:hypothetical protein